MEDKKDVKVKAKLIKDKDKDQMASPKNLVTEDKKYKQKKMGKV